MMEDGIYEGTADQETTTTEVLDETEPMEVVGMEAAKEAGITTGEFHELGTVNQKPGSTSNVGVVVIYANVG